MILHPRILLWLTGVAYRIASRRNPDQVIGGRDNPYMKRWWVTPWRAYVAIPRDKRTRWQRFVVALGLPNVYVHEFWRSDDDRALHDHPWANLSILLEGEYTEHTVDAGGIHRRVIRRAGDVVARRAAHAHRIELHAGMCWTLFVTGFKTRNWGFHCPEQGWIDWYRFTNSADGGETVGPGCDA